MKWIIVGLGNPGKEYEKTRHNAGRLVVESFATMCNSDGFLVDTKSKSDIAYGSVDAHEVMLVTPNTFMNNSGGAVKAYVKTKKGTDRLIVVYDDIDLPFGALRISYGRGTGGHKGLESIIKETQTKDFVRVRIGVAPVDQMGNIRKPHGERKVEDYVLGNFTEDELEALAKDFTRIHSAIQTIITRGRVVAMDTFN